MADKVAPADPFENTPGFVPIESYLAGRAGLSQDAQPGLISRAYSAVAQPLTNAISKTAGAVLDTASLAGPMAGVPERPGATQQAFAPFTQQIGQAVVPQTPTDAAILAGTAGAGGLAARAGLTGIRASGARILGSTLGGLGGGMAEDTSSPMGAALGGAKGLATGAIGEAIGGLTNFGRNVGIDRIRTQIQAADAAGVGKALEQNPKLGGVFNGMRTPEQLRELALGTVTLPDGKVVNAGIAKLQAQQEAAQSAITDLIAKRPKLDPLSGVGRTYPESAGAERGHPSLGTWELGQYSGERAGWFPDPQNPKNFVPWEEWKKSFSELGAKAFGGPKGNPLEPTINGVDTKQRWAEAAREVRDYLMNYDPSGKAVAIFEAAQQQHEAGRYALKTLRSAFQRLDPSRVAFNSDRMQAVLSRKETEATKKLGAEGYDALITALNHGNPSIGPGRQDLFSPSGVLSRMAEILPGPGGTYARLRVGEPSLIGNPLHLSQGQRTGLTLGTQAAGLPLMNRTGLGMDLSQGLSGLPPITLATPSGG